MMDWEVFGGIILAVLMTAAIGGWLGAADFCPNPMASRFSGP